MRLEEVGLAGVEVADQSGDDPDDGGLLLLGQLVNLLKLLNEFGVPPLPRVSPRVVMKQGKRKAKPAPIGGFGAVRRRC